MVERRVMCRADAEKMGRNGLNELNYRLKPFGAEKTDKTKLFLCSITSDLKLLEKGLRSAGLIRQRAFTLSEIK